MEHYVRRLPRFFLARVQTPDLNRLGRHIVLILYHSNPLHWIVVHIDRKARTICHWDSSFRVTC